jgi:hypothetical protein
VFFFSPPWEIFRRGSPTNTLTFPGIRDLLGGAFLRGQKLLNTLRLAGHLYEWRTTSSVTNRSYDFRASALCPALNDGAPCLVLAHVALLYLPPYYLTALGLSTQQCFCQVFIEKSENCSRNHSHEQIFLTASFKRLRNKFKMPHDNVSRLVAVLNVT